MSDLTNALADLRDGDQQALERLISLLYDDLRRVARQRLRSERDWHTLGTTGLVHEAYLRLVREQRINVQDRSEFLAAASNTMRRLLVDYARTRNRQKRGGGIEPVELDKVAPFLSDSVTEEMIELDNALSALSRHMPRAARFFEQKTFGGLEHAEIAEIAGVSSKTVQRDLAGARAWLRKEVAIRLDSDRDSGLPLSP